MFPTLTTEKEKTICDRLTKEYLPLNYFQILMKEFRGRVYEKVKLYDRTISNFNNDIKIHGYKKSLYDNEKVYIRKTDSMGAGVFALEKIAKGERICRFDGLKLMSPRTCFFPNDAPELIDDHLFQVGEDLHIYPRHMLSGFLNHSCDPNCGIKGDVDLYAMRDIQEGEQITWDYDTSDDSDWFMTCKCNAPNCRKLIRGFRHLSQKDRERYKGYIANWLVNKYGLNS